MEAELDLLRMATAMSRHASQKQTPDVTRAAKYQTSSGGQSLTIDANQVGEFGDSEGPSQATRSVVETRSHVLVPKEPKSERGGQVKGTQTGRFKGGIGETGGASRYQADLASPVTE